MGAHDDNANGARDERTLRNEPAHDRAIRRDALERSIASRLGACSHDELRIFDVMLERVLKVGRASHPQPLDLARDRRDWRSEAADEHADALFYMLADAVVANDRRLEQLRAEADRELGMLRAVESSRSRRAAPQRAHDWPGPFDLGGEA